MPPYNAHYDRPAPARADLVRPPRGSPALLAHGPPPALRGHSPSGCGLGGVTMTLHKLSAGSGYEYLTRQVAAGDDTEIGPRGLEDYYAAKGESPGRWTGSGLIGIDGLESGDRVTSAQMANLFGAGRHPLTGVALGAAYRVYDIDAGGFNAEVARRLDVGADGSTEPAKRLAQVAAARSEVAREYFVREQGREPRDARELASAVARYSRPQRTAV